MKSFKNIYHTVCLTGLLALGTSSCTDWLTIYPQDRVVEENFWEDKNDLEGVRYGAYRQMAQTVSKLAVWGDLRSDSYAINSVEHQNQGNRDTYIEIINGMPDSSMGVFDWSGVYTTINYCNKVLQHGEEVLERDKQFTSGEWILTNQLAVLDSIILDCERVKGKARNRFSDKRDSKGMITNCAIYAMLADMYLWRASLHEGRHDKNTQDSIVINGNLEKYTIADDYNKAVEYADLSLQSLANQNNEERVSFGFGSGGETFNYGLTNCDMIKNNFEGAAQATTPELEAQTAIFNTKNSRESIFELQYSLSDELTNTIVNSLYGFGNGTHLQVNKDAIDALYNGGISGTGDNGGMWDSRVWVCCQNKLTTGNDAATTQAQAEQFTEVVDKALQRINIEYKTKRESLRLKDAVTYRLQPESFERFKERCIAEGARDGQFKLNLLLQDEKRQAKFNDLTIK